MGNAEGTKTKQNNDKYIRDKNTIKLQKKKKKKKKKKETQRGIRTEYLQNSLIAVSVCVALLDCPNTRNYVSQKIKLNTVDP